MLASDIFDHFLVCVMLPCTIASSHFFSIAAKTKVGLTVAFSK